MKPKPTGIRFFLSEVILLGVLACSNPLPPTVPTGSTEATTNEFHLSIFEFGGQSQRTMAPPAIGRVWVDRNGQVLGFFFATPGCDLCENRDGLVAVFLSSIGGADPIDGDGAFFGRGGINDSLSGEAIIVVPSGRNRR